MRCFYAGGEKLAAFRGIPAVACHPEEWLGSTTARWGGSRESLTVLPSGRVLAEEMQERPEFWLGSFHLRRHGADPGLLVKLLDVGQRLPVHAHPSPDFATWHLRSNHGKNEAWVVLDAEPGAAVYLGLREAVSKRYLCDAITRGDTDLIAQLNRLEVRPGDSLFVPAGTLHSIDPGVFVLELQEPTDLSLLLEWRETGLSREQALLRLEPKLAVEALRADALGFDHLLALWRRDEGGPGEGAFELLPEAAQGHFHAQHVFPGEGVELPAGFAVAVVTEGRGGLRIGASSLDLSAGDALLLPWAAGGVKAEGEMRMILCRPAVA